MLELNQIIHLIEKKIASFCKDFEVFIKKADILQNMQGNMNEFVAYPCAK